MVRLFDIPGIPEIENRLVLNALTGVKKDHELDRMIEAVMRDTFELDPIYELSGMIFEWGDGSDAAIISGWRQAQWDVTGPDGKVLEAVNIFGEAMAAMVEGLGQRSMVELEATTWANKNAPKARIDPKTKARNQQFLNLGPRRRSAA
ncbi:hypothetical protein ACWQV9_11160 [Brevundimonas diminuta]